MCVVFINSRDPRRHRDEVDFAIREFRKKVKKAGILQEVRRREHYVAPAKKRKLKAEESRRQRRRDERKAHWHKERYG